MTAIAATATADSKEYGFDALPTLLYNVPVAASANCRKGGIAVSALTGTGAGYAKPGVTALNLQVLGRFEDSFDNTGGSAGGTSIDAPVGRSFVQVRAGAFWFKNSSSSDAIAQANCFGDCFIVDDQTVALTDGSGTRSRAGMVLAVDTTLDVLVLIGVGAPSRTPRIQVVSPGTGTTLASGTKAVGGSGGTFSLTASSVIIPVTTATNSSSAIGAQYEISAITTGAAGTAAFTVTATAAAGTTVTGDTSILAFIIVG